VLNPPTLPPSERLTKLNANMESKESLKSVSLGTSKINYLDPRCVPPTPVIAARDSLRLCSITVAWCKMHEVPIERVYTKVGSRLGASHPET